MDVVGSIKIYGIDSVRIEIKMLVFGGFLIPVVPSPFIILLLRLVLRSLVSLVHPQRSRPAEVIFHILKIHCWVTLNHA
jgi:hypothetical protein